MKSNNICKFPDSIITSNPLSILCFVRETDPNIMHIKRKLSANKILLLTDGEATIRINGGAFDLSKGSLIFCFAGESIVFENCDKAVYMYIDFEGMRSTELFRRFDITPLSRQYDGFDGLIPIWQESLFRASEKTIDLSAESTMLYSFSKLFDRTGADGGLITQIIRLTEENFKDPDLCISQIAKELSYNPKYLSHIFKEKARVSYSEYLRSVRLKYATMLFDHGIDSVKNVALLSGFSDPLYFSNVFKKSIGMSPREYIDTVKNK